MYVIREDALIIKTPECRKLREQYEKKFGVRMTPFNYADFHWREDKTAAHMYIEAMRKALETGVPFKGVDDPFTMKISDDE